MKTIAVITEFNPFHNGHEYFLKTIRERSGADRIIAVMSGDFVQRGEPAIVDKYARTKMALSGGCDLVLELPVRFALGNAGSFAAGGIEILDSLGVVDELWFGSECGRIDRIKTVAKILLDEPETFKASLQDHLKAGESYPKAREAALRAVAGEDYSDVISKPNNILGLEYCMAVQKAGSRIGLNTIQRVGADYESDDLSGAFPSALAVRKALSRNKKGPADITSEGISVLSTSLPPYAMELLLNEPGFLTADDFSELLKYRLMEETAESLAAYLNVSPDLARRIKNLENEFTGFTDFALKVKSKNVTYTHISRAFFSILLKLRYPVPVTAIRVLGMKDCKDLLKEIKEKGRTALFTGSVSMPELEYDRDLFASNLYESLKAVRYSCPFIHENSKKFIKL